jgi:hypothetical protein
MPVGEETSSNSHQQTYTVKRQMEIFKDVTVHTLSNHSELNTKELISRHLFSTMKITKQEELL